MPIIDFNGLSLTRAGWAKFLAIRAGTLNNRFYSGWSLKKALSTPVRPLNGTPGKKLDVVGKRYNRLTILRRRDPPAHRPNYPGNGRSWVIARCDCGREDNFDLWKLRCGHTKSCGCLQGEQNFKLNQTFVGRRFTRLLVTSVEQKMVRRPRRGPAKPKTNELDWFARCQCDCGANSINRLANLKQGLVKSCGCLRREQCMARCAKGGRAAQQKVRETWREKCREALVQMRREDWRKKKREFRLRQSAAG